MIYVTSDIHGEKERFDAMLQAIEFSDQDTLYIIGDVIDRKPYGVPILLDIMAHNNMVLLRGNHEQMCLDTLGKRSVFGARAIWMSNGGSVTRRDLLYLHSPAERNRILRFLEDSPLDMALEVNRRRFYLVHGMPGETAEQKLWGRPKKETRSPWPDVTVIVGHTPTCLITDDYKNPLSIWHGNGIIDIDCGCGKSTALRRLACLRLDDMKELYF